MRERRVIWFIAVLALVAGVFAASPAWAGTISLQDDSAHTSPGTSVNINVLANDSYDAPPVTVAVANGPSNGTAVVQGNNTITYNPSQGFTGSDFFGYSVTDNDGVQNFANVTVDVGNAIVSAGPLTRVATTPDLNCAVNHSGDSAGEFFGDTACGTFLVVDGAVYSPASVPAGYSGTAWTPVSQSVSGSGTAADPYQIVTKVAAGGTGVTLTQTDSYVVGSESLRTDDVVHNGSTARSVTLYRAADCYLNDSDSGLGQVDTQSGAVACKSSASNRIEQWLPLSAGSHYYEAGFDEVWNAVAGMQPFPDTCRCAENIDNGAGLSWSAAMAANDSLTRSSLITFSPAGAAPLTVSATATPGSVGGGGDVTYHVTVSNSGNADAALTAITDTLPAGFSYVAGSTTGATTTNPTVSGADLTWTLSATVPAQGSTSLTFHATATSTPGTYYDQATGTATGVDVVGTGDTAPVTVSSNDTTPPGPVQNLSATPGDATVGLDWTNPTDADLQKIRVFYQAGPDAPAYGQGTEVTLGSLTPQHASVTGLTNGTEYSFAVFAVDTAGNHSAPSAVSATPNAATGVEPVTDLQAASAGTNAVTLTWTNPATLSGIVVRYSTTSPPATVTDGTGFPVSGTPQTATVTGLTTGTHYYFSVFATSGGIASPPTSIDFTPFACPDLSTAMNPPSGLVTGSSWVACSAPDANANDNALNTLLPKTGTTQALMTTGDRAIANPPDQGGSQGRDNGSGSRGAYDVSIYRMDLNVPAGAQCLSFDYVFASEEYPEYVGSSFNDGFLAQVDQNNWTVSGSNITAQGNFAKTSDGGYVSVNGPVFADPSKVAGPDTNGTAYDGMSLPLRASTPITPGQHSVYLSIFDAGDGVLDSAAFLDSLRTSTSTCQAGTFLPPHAVNDTATTPSGQAVTTNVLANDTDPSNEALSVTGHTNGTHGTVSCTTTACTYTPSSASFVGSDSYTYTVSNTDGQTDVGTVSVTVTNRAPHAVADTATTPSGQAVTTNVLANDTDPEGQALSVTAHTNGTHGTVTCTTSACAYTPSSSSFVGTDSYTYTVSDGNGGTDVGTVTVTVTNRAPHAVADTATTASGQAVTTNVLANDTDPEGQALSVSAHTNGAHGTVTCTTSACTYTSVAGFTGTDSYTYTVSDGNGGTDVGTVTVTVTNPGPHAVADTATTPSGQAVTTNVLANDTDSSGEALSVSAHTNGAHGTVTCTASACTYTPSPASFVGTDSYTYTVQDTAGLTDVGTVTVTVTNRAPHAVADTATTVSGQAATTNVLANDTDPEGQALSVSAHTNGAHGTVTCTSSACTYTSAAGFTGTDTYTYTVSDGLGGTDVGTVTVTVTPAGAAAMTIARSVDHFVWPLGVTITGRLATAQGAPAPGQAVELWAQTAGGAWARVATTSTGSDGTASVSTRPATHTTYQWRVTGTSLTSPTTTVDVAPRVTLSGRTSVSMGHKVKLTGVASPVRAGAAVQLQRFSGGSWHTVASSTFAAASASTTSGSPYSFKVRQGHAGTQRYRVVVPSDSGRLAGTSPVLQIRVYDVHVLGVRATGDEVVTIRNAGPVALDLTGWTLLTRSGHHMTLPHHTLASGATLRIHPGSGHSHGGDLYLGGSAMLGDRHDVVTLKDADGVRAARYAY